MEKGKSYLVFSEGEELFGLNLGDVERVEKSCLLDKNTAFPPHVKGLLCYHGKSIPVIDIRKIFCLKDREDQLSDLIIIIKTVQRRLGIWVESVKGVVNKDQQEVQDAQRMFLELDYVKGVFYFSDKMVLLSDVDSLLTEREMQKLKKVLSAMGRAHE